MRKVLLTIAILMVPVSSFAQITNCPNCVLGVFDDQMMTQNFGIWAAPASPAKTVWVGILYDPATKGELNGFTGVELSVDGIPAGPFGDPGFNGVPDPTVTIGSTIVTPDDEVAGTGGVNMAWDTCLQGDRAMIRIDMLSLDAVPSDIVVQVRRKFPPGSPSFPQQLITQCNAPIFTSTLVTGGCYVINPSVGVGQTVNGCTLVRYITAVEKNTWGRVKALYRD